MDQPALLGHRDARRRLPLRSRRDAGARGARGRPLQHVLRRHPAGSRAVAGQADRRAVGPGRRRLPGRQLSAGLDRVERQVPRRRALLLERRRRPGRRARLPPVGLERSLRAQRARPDGEHQLRHRARRLHAARPRELQREAQRGERRGQPRRRVAQPELELRRRGPDRRSRDQGSARAAEAQPPRHPALLAGRAHAARRRRAGTHAGREQQRLLPGQRGVVGRTGSSPRKRASSWNSPAASSRCATRIRSSGDAPSFAGARCAIPPSRT